MSDDQLTLDLSQQPDYAVPFVRNSEWLWTLDQAPSGNYSSGTSIMDTSSLSNSNKWLNWQSAYLAIPQRIRCKVTASAGTITPVASQYMAGIKSGFQNTINSCQVEINGVTVQQSTQLSNLVWNYRILTNMSYNDLIKYGSTLGFYPDDSNTWNYLDAASVVGPSGFVNNTNGLSILTTAGGAAATDGLAGGSGIGINSGFLKRQNWLSYSLSATNHSSANTQAYLNTIFKSYAQSSAFTAGASGETIFNMMAMVRLRDICPLFAQLGLCKGLLVRLTMTLNQPSFTLSITNPANVVVIASAVSYPYGGQTNPVMIASAAQYNGSQGLIPGAAGSNTAVVDFRVGTTSFSTVSVIEGSTGNPGPFGQQNIRLWVQSCILAPEQEAELIANPIRKFKYNDIYETDFAVNANETKNQLLFNGVPRCRRLIMVPLNVGGPSNIFDGQGGGCTMPMAGLTNYQVYLSGMPLFPTPVQYDYRFYMEQFARSGLNYGMVEGLSSGLIGQDQWENNYRYYVVDLHQGLESEDDVTKNIQVSLQSQSSVNMQMYCFVEYERQLELNILSSAVVSFK